MKSEYQMLLLILFSDENLSSEQSDWLSTLFDVGGIIGKRSLSLTELPTFIWVSRVGGIATGLLSDVLNARALSCVLSLILAVPSVSDIRSRITLHVDFITCFYLVVSPAVHWWCSHLSLHKWVAVGFPAGAVSSLYHSPVLLIVSGIFINGPYAIITTAVSSDLVGQPSAKSFFLYRMWHLSCRELIHLWRIIRMPRRRWLPSLTGRVPLELPWVLCWLDGSVPPVL